MRDRILLLTLGTLLLSCDSDSGGTTGPDPVPTSISVSPLTVTLDAIGATAQFSASVRDQDGQVMQGASVTWSTSNSSVLGVHASSGLATAAGVGDATVTASSGTATGSATATVQQVATQMAVSLGTDQLAPGANTQATVSAQDAMGNPIPSPDGTWESSDLLVATVDAQGDVTAQAPGLVHIVSRLGTLSDSARLSVSSAFDGDQLTVVVGGSGEVAVFTNLEGGTHFQLSVEDGHGQPLVGATIKYAEVGERTLFSVKGPGDGYAPAFLFGPPAGILALGQPLSVSGLPESTPSLYPGGPQAVITQAARLTLTLPAASGVGLDVIEDGLNIPTFYFDPNPIGFGADGTYRGRKCMTWEQLSQHMEDRLGLIPAWTDAALTLVRSDSPSYFDPTPVGGAEDVYFPTQGVVHALTGEDLLGEKIALLGAMLQESATGPRVEVTWDFAEEGPESRQALGWYRVRTNDRFCGGDIPETLTALTPTLTGEPDTQVQPTVKVQSTWGNAIPGVEVVFSLTGSDQGSLEGGPLEVTRVTDAEGIAMVPWTLPATEGAYTVSASVSREEGQPLSVSMAGEAQTSSVVPTLASFAAGFDHTCGLTPLDGTYCWGANAWGQLGIGVRGAGEGRSTPSLVSESVMQGFQSIGAGFDFTCALDSGGRSYCWGRNDHGQLGSGDRVDVAETPRMVEDGLIFVELVSGKRHSCGLTSDGTAYCWGDNDEGQLGNGTQADSIRPGAVSGGQQFETLAAGDEHTCGISTTGAAFCWGSNAEGGLGDGTLERRLVPTQVGSAEVFSSLTAGATHTCGQTASGGVFCWGGNQYGQLGLGHETDTPTPTQIGGTVSFVSVDAGGYHSCGLTSGGEAYCWGRNHLGQVGDGSLSTKKSSPSKVLGLHTYAIVQAGPFHTCGLTGNGTAFCWGSNSDSELGLGEGGPLFSNQPLEVVTELKFGRPPSS